LPLTINIARRWGKLSAEIGNTNLDLGIAATAFEHGLMVVTRNVAHYERTGVAIVNPFEARSRKR
jgi:predicted nucleic acid-binding protein